MPGILPVFIATAKGCFVLSYLLSSCVRQGEIVRMAADLPTVAEYAVLKDHYKVAKDWNMRTLFEEDPNRFKTFR